MTTDEYESDSIDGVQPRMIEIPAEEWERLKAQLAAARAALKAVEWIPLHSTVTRSYCPWCRGTTGFYGGEHSPTCQRQAALAEAQP